MDPIRFIVYVRCIQDTDEGFNCHVGTPLKSIIIMLMDCLVIDVKHKSKSGPSCHHFGICGFVPEVMKYVMSGRNYISDLSSTTYQIAFRSYLDRLIRDLSKEEVERYLFIKLEGVIADFSIAQRNGVRDAIESLFPGRGQEFIEAKYKGCRVHYKRTVMRVIQALGLDENTAIAFKNTAFKVVEMKDETQIRNTFIGLRSIVPGSKSWCNFWSTEDMIKMLISEEDSNPIESLNCHSVATGGNLSIELETNYREDMAHDVLVINTCDGISYTYRKKKEKKVTVDISHPPEKRKEGIQINQSVDIQALEGFISELKESTLKDIQESCSQDDPKDKDYESDSSQ